MRTANTLTLLLLLIYAGLGCAAEVASDGTPPQPEPLARAANASCVAGPAAAVPVTLSQLGCMNAANPSQPGPALVPYDVVAPLFTDDAEKSRWLALPDGTAMSVAPDGKLVLPPGAVLLKTFARAGKLLETRVWLNHPDAGFRPYTYRWNDQGTDAVLASEAGEQLVSASGRHWDVPSRGQCTQCHGSSGNPVLGLTLLQLDRDGQLERWEASGLITAGARATAPTAVPPARLVDPHDSAQPLEARARSYLHANCSTCHNQADGYCTGDFRIGTPSGEMGVCNVAPKQLDPSWGWLAGTQLIAPGDPEKSALWLRLSAPGGSVLAMPPVGRHEVDAAGVELIAAWISSLSACPR